MHTTREAGELGSTDRLSGDALPKRIVQGTRGKEVNSSFEDVFQVLLQPHNCEVSGGSPELYKEIDVTLRPSFVADHRPEEDETDDAKTSQLFPVGPQNSQYIVASQRSVTTAHYPRNPVISPQTHPPGAGKGTDWEAPKASTTSGLSRCRTSPHPRARMAVFAVRPSPPGRGHGQVFG